VSSLNKVQIIGRLGDEPAVRDAGGTQVCSLSVATSESFTDKSGKKRDQTEWHKLVLWGKLAELAGRYLYKGALCYFEGKLQTRQWEKDGQKRYATEIVVQSMQFLSKREDGAERRGSGAPRQAPQSEFNYGPPPVDADDIPF
jgi:single-strand DNA-binding protein